MINIKNKTIRFFNNVKFFGWRYGLRQLILFIFRPFSNLIRKSEFLLNFRYGFLPSLIYSIYCSGPKLFKINSTDLMEKVKEFWYSNNPGYFDLDGEKISRKDIFIYGGPNFRFTCPICQKAEWLSRVRQKNLFISHNCPQAKECEDVCKKQGDDLWTHYHQNFDFGIGCRSDLPAAKCLMLRPNASRDKILSPRCDQGILVSWRRFAYAFQRDIVERPVGIKWTNYDFLWVFIDSFSQKFSRPKLPIILYGHDFWTEDKSFQWVIDWLKPDIFLTSYPTQWRENFKFSPQTKIVFFPLFPSLFFTRPNLEKKKLDLLVIGATTSPIYKERVILAKQIRKLNSKYKVEFSHWTGALSSLWQGPAEYIDPISKKTVRYLNKWSEYLSSARYVIFGKIADPKKQFLLWKYYETLGSGAIPIFPEVPDLKLLGVKPFEHYIPLSEVEGNNDKLTYYLDNYEKYRHIAENAVNWYKENCDKMLFEDFENLIREITNYKYPKRLI
ncbi:MAG: hypothetical protein ACPLW9_01150 [Minisyncoccales bacterium]